MRRVVLLILVVMALGVCAHAASKVVMVVLPAVSFEDLNSADLPTIHKLIQTGSIGLMNARTGGRLDAEAGDYTDSKYTPESGYLTIGAGARAIAGMDARQAFNRAEVVEGVPAYRVLQQRTLAKPGDSEVVHIGIAKMQYDNAELNYDVTVGALGDAIHAAGLRTAVVGNSDDKTVHREAATICMDGKGLVDFGNVGRADLLAEAERSMGLADFILIEIGETARVDRGRLDLMDAVYQRERAKALKDADRILGRLLITIVQQATLIILSPYPSSYAVEKTGSNLCPVIVSGPGFSYGLLTSGSTKAPGVIANTDIAPSILKMLRVPAPASLVGRPITSIPHNSPADELLGLSERTSTQALSQPVLRQVMTAIIVLVGIITVLWLMLSGPRRKRLWPLILFPSAIAPAFLLMSLWPSASHSVAWFRLIVFSLAIIAIARLIAWQPTKALALVSLAFVGLVAADLVTGGALCGSSIMGYSIVEGARYYGIGNEFMGALIGSSLAGLGLLFGAFKSGRAIQIGLMIGLVAGTVVVGAPMLGANTGGALAMAAAFGITLAATCRRPFRWLLGILLIGVVLIAGLAVMDSLRGEQYESHLGRAVRLAGSGGLAQIGMLMKRKLLMNLLLIKVGVWSRALVAYGISLAAVLYLGGALPKISPMPARLRIALTGVISGTLAALIFNDSGIVAAATCFVYAWSLVLLSALEKEKEQAR